MRSSSFVSGFNKTAGVGALVTKPVKALWKGTKYLAGGTLGAVATGVGALSEGAAGMRKMTEQASRG